MKEKEERKIKKIMGIEYDPDFRKSRRDYEAGNACKIFGCWFDEREIPFSIIQVFILFGFMIIGVNIWNYFFR